MPRHSYRERDYAFGQAMLTLRSRMGLTQVGLADLLGVSRRAVAAWEGGGDYPKAEHLQHFIALCVQQHVFPAGREEAEIRALWKTAHQRVLLDERWLAAVLTRPSALPAPVAEADAAAEMTGPPAPVPLSPPAETRVVHAGAEPAATRRVDWVGALDVSYFTGREVEVAELSQWILEEHCRLVALLGMGGIGKSTLASLLGQRLARQFEAVLWRSVRDAPPCEELVADCLTFFSETPPATFPSSLEQRINQLVSRLQASRCLLVLDNLESLLVSGDPEGNYLPGYEGYGRLLQRLAEEAHQSCVLLTSREKPREIEPLEGGTQAGALTAPGGAGRTDGPCPARRQGTRRHASRLAAPGGRLRGQSPGTQNRGAGGLRPLRGRSRPLPAGRRTGLQRRPPGAASAGGASLRAGVPPAHVAGRVARVDGAEHPGAGAASPGAARAGLGGAGGAATALAAGTRAAGQLQPAIGGDGVPHRCAGRTPGQGDRAGKPAAGAPGGLGAGAGQRLRARDPGAPAGPSPARAAAFG